MPKQFSCSAVKTGQTKEKEDEECHKKCRFSSLTLTAG